MRRSYPIWCEVTGTGRKEDPRFGSRDSLEFQIYVGTSARNSHHALGFKFYKVVDMNGDISFYLDIDGHTVAKFNDEGELI